GNRGFLTHCLPLLLILPALVLLVRRRLRADAEVLFGLAWSVGSWLLYAAFSNNYAGGCCSIRWFLPLLVPGFYLIGLLLREYPAAARDLAILGGWGLLLGVVMWLCGPWWLGVVPGQGVIAVLALLSWGVAAWRRSR